MVFKTITTILEPTPEQQLALRQVMQRVAEAKTHVAARCYEMEDCNFFRMQKTTYGHLRNELKLPAQLAVTASKYACAAVKSAIRAKNNCPHFGGKTIHFDPRSSRISTETKTASLLTLDGRVKIPFRMTRYFHKYEDWKIKGGDLVLCRDGKFRLFLSVEKSFDRPTKNGKTLGVDRGINCLMATSEGILVEGKEVFGRKKHYVNLRGRLRSKGTRSAKRHLAKIRGKEKRFMKDINHCLSKRLIRDAGEGGVIVFENLKGIGKHRRRHGENWLFSNWAFRQLEEFTKYKAEEASVGVEFVPAYHTSRVCSRCGEIGSRRGSSFTCQTCNQSAHADINAARNILRRYQTIHGLPVNQPIVLPEGIEQTLPSAE